MEARRGQPIDSIDDLKITFLFNTGALIAIVLFFSITRPCRSSERTEHTEQLLSHRSASAAVSSKNPPITTAESTHRSIFEWIKVLSKISDREVIVHCRKDGFLYLLFIKYLYTYFFFLSLGGCCVLLPIFLVNTKIDAELLAAYTIRSILEEKWKLWVVLAFTVVYSVMAFVMLYLFHKRLRSVAASENKTMIDSLCSKRALQIDGIPRHFIGRECEEQIQEFFEEFAGEGEVISVKLVPDYKDIYKLILEKNAILEKLEKVKKANMRIHIREKIRRGICCCKEYVDAESEYTRELERIQCEEKAQKFFEERKESIGTAFIIFKSPEKAFAAKRIISRKFHLAPRYSHLQLQNWRIFKAPPPSDIYWENIGISPHRRLLLFLVANLPLILLTTLMVVPITILDELKSIVDLINQEMQQKGIQPSWTTVFIDNYFPPLLLYLNSALIVPFLIYYVSRYERKERKSYLEKSILAKNITFMLFDIIILPSFGLSTIYSLFERHDWYFFLKITAVGFVICPLK